MQAVFPGEQTVCQDRLFWKNFLQQTATLCIGLQPQLPRQEYPGRSSYVDIYGLDSQP